MVVRWAAALCLLLLTPVSALPPPLPTRLRRFSAQVQAATEDARTRCTCDVGDVLPTQIYPNCLASSSPPRQQHCVPRIIHQTGKDSTPPRKDRLHHLSWVQLNPGWIVLLWSDADVLEWMQENYPWFMGTFRSYETPVQQADAFRYFVLHAYGGIYADLDYEALAPLDSFVPSINRPLAFVGPGDWRTSISNSLMVSRYCPHLWEPLHRRLEASAASAARGFWGLWPSSRVMSSTGPTFLRTWLETQRPAYACRLVRAQFSPCDYCTAKCRPPEGALAIHHYAQSWNTADTLLLNFIVCNWRYLAAAALLLCVVRVQPHVRLVAVALLCGRCRELCRTEVLYVAVALCLALLIALAMPS